MKFFVIAAVATAFASVYGADLETAAKSDRDTKCYNGPDYDSGVKHTYQPGSHVTIKCKVEAKNKDGTPMAIGYWLKTKRDCFVANPRVVADTSNVPVCEPLLIDVDLNVDLDLGLGLGVDVGVDLGKLAEVGVGVHL